MSTLEMVKGGYEAIEDGIMEIKQTAWDGTFTASDLKEVSQCLQSIVVKAENLRLTVQSVLLAVPDSREIA